MVGTGLAGAMTAVEWVRGVGGGRAMTEGEGGGGWGSGLSARPLYRHACITSDYFMSITALRDAGRLWSPPCLDRVLAGLGQAPAAQSEACM